MSEGKAAQRVQLSSVARLAAAKQLTWHCSARLPAVAAGLPGCAALGYQQSQQLIN